MHACSDSHGRVSNNANSDCVCLRDGRHRLTRLSVLISCKCTARARARTTCAYGNCSFYVSARKQGWCEVVWVWVWCAVGARVMRVCVCVRSMCGWCGVRVCSWVFVCVCARARARVVVVGALLGCVCCAFEVRSTYVRLRCAALLSLRRAAPCCASCTALYPLRCFAQCALRCVRCTALRCVALRCTTSRHAALRCARCVVICPLHCVTACYTVCIACAALCALLCALRCVQLRCLQPLCVQLHALCTILCCMSSRARKRLAVVLRRIPHGCIADDVAGYFIKRAGLSSVRRVAHDLRRALISAERIEKIKRRVPPFFVAKLMRTAGANKRDAIAGVCVVPLFCAFAGMAVCLRVRVGARVIPPGAVHPHGLRQDPNVNAGTRCRAHMCPRRETMWTDRVSVRVLYTHIYMYIYIYSWRAGMAGRLFVWHGSGLPFSTVCMCA